MHNKDLENNSESNIFEGTDLHKFIQSYIKNYNNENKRKTYKREFQDFNGEVSIKANSFEELSLNLTNEEKIKIKDIIKFNLDDTISLINNNNKIYNLTNLDETNTYINHYLSNINNVILSFNQLLLKLVSSYSINKCVSFYDQNDNVIIKENNELYQKIRDYFNIKQEVIIDNDKINDFNCSLQFLKIDKNNLLENLVENKKIFNENKKIFNFDYYIKNQYRYAKKIERNFQKAILKYEKILNDSNKLINENKKILNTLPNEEDIKKLKEKLESFTLLKKQSDDSYKEELNKIKKEYLSDECLFKLKKIKMEIEKFSLNKNKQLLLLNKSNNYINSLSIIKKDNLYLMDYLCNKNELFFNNYDSMIEYNKLIVKLKKFKFKKLNIGFEKLFLAGGKSNNNNSIEKLISFFVDNKVVPKLFMNIFYLYESLLRHQYSHGWHSALQLLFSSEITGNSELNLNSEEFHKVLVDKKTQENYLSILRSEIKKHSLNNKTEFISRLNLFIEFNMKKSFSSIDNEELSSHKELIYTIEMNSNTDFLNELIMFQKKYNINIFDEKKINDYIKNCDGKYFYISLNSLIYYIFVFISFYIKTNSDIDFKNPFTEDGKRKIKINKRKNPDKFFCEYLIK